MAREKKPVHIVQMTEGKRNIIHHLLEKYDIETAEDFQGSIRNWESVYGELYIMYEECLPD